MSVRLDQIASVLRRTIQESIGRDLHDPRIRGLISVTGVEVAPDLSEAVVRVSVAPEEHAELTMHGLRHASGRIRSAIARAVRLRRVPRLSFRLDPTLKNQATLEASMREAVEPHEGGPPAEPHEGSA